MISYSVLGWASAIILGILVLPFILVRLNKAFFKTQNKNFFELIKLLRKTHKVLGVLLVGIAFYHGYLALGSIKFHTGTVLYVGVLLTVILGGVFYRIKNKTAFSYHKILAGIVVVLLFIHIFYPYAFSGIF